MPPPVPTLRQREFLSSRGILVPPSKAAASTIIGFVKKGNFAGSAETESQRIGAVIAAQTRFNGKRVQHRTETQWTGEVRYILAKSAHEMLDRQKVGEDTGDKSPFRAHVVWDNREDCRTSQITLGNIDPIE